MTQTIPVTVQLGASQTGKAMGYRVLNLNRTVYSAFTVVNVAETVPLGTYSVSGGVVAPDAGGYVIVGTSGVDIFEFAFDASIVSSVATGVTLADDAITAAKIASNAIDADALASDAVAEIQNGLATPTNIIGGTITTVTNLTNAPANGDLTATMKASVTTAATAATPTVAAVSGNVAGSVGSVTSPVTVGTNNDKTGYALSGAGIQAIWDALTSAFTTAGSIGKRIVDYLDIAVSSRMATSSYTTPPTAAQIDTQLTGTHGAGVWSTATGFATPTNVADAQTAIIDAIADLDALTVEQVQDAAEAALLNYDVATVEDVERIGSIVSTSTSVSTDGSLYAIKGVTFDATITGLTIPVAWKKIYLTVKKGLASADTDATIQIVKSNPDAVGDGLTVLNAAVAVTKTDGSLVINQMAGTVVIQIKDNAMAVVPKTQTGSHQYYYDIKILTSDGESTRPHHGHMVVGLTATAAIE